MFREITEVQEYTPKKKKEARALIPDFIMETPLSVLKEENKKKLRKRLSGDAAKIPDFK